MAGGQEPTADERIAALTEEVKGLRQEAKNYRQARNDALRKSHAYRTILDAHKIDLSVVTDHALANLSIEGGKVDSEFTYTPPQIDPPKRAPAKAAGEGKGGLTKDDLKGMKPEEINRRWSEVRSVLAA